MLKRLRPDESRLLEGGALLLEAFGAAKAVQRNFREAQDHLILIPPLLEIAVFADIARVWKTTIIYLAKERLGVNKEPKAASQVYPPSSFEKGKP